MELNIYILSLTIIGFVGLSMSWLPSLMRKMKMSYTIVFMLFGVLIYTVFDEQLPWPDPYRTREYTVYLTELIVIIALMGTGLTMERPFSFKAWAVPLRLVTILMVLSVAIMALIGYFWLGFAVSTALLLGAVLAPTDPVLASDVQARRPNSGDRSNIRFSLTAEAGLNDGMAFPFTWLAIAVAAASVSGEPWFMNWLIDDLILKTLIGLVAGYAFGRIIAYLFFKLPEKYETLHVRDGLVALSTTLLVYGGTELMHGYGFLAVFVAAVTIRSHEVDHKYHEDLYDFITQVERILLAVLLLLFGGSLAEGILSELTWPMALAGIFFVVVLRPALGMLSLMGTDLPMPKKWAISFFGIKGIGSFFYLSFAMALATFPMDNELWSLTAFVVLMSILIHGFTAKWVMEKFHQEDKDA